MNEHEKLVASLTNSWIHWISMGIAVACIAALMIVDGLGWSIMLGYLAFVCVLVAWSRWYTRKKILEHEANNATEEKH